MIIRESVMVGGKPMTFETGRIAKQAESAVLVTYGDTQVLVTLCYGPARPGIGFFPLTCDYIEKTYAAGKIPGGFFKREARLRDDEILTCRIMDRPCRPLFADGFKMETQLMATVMSSDKENKADVLALTGASLAIHLSCLPWDGPICGIRVGRLDGEFVANPTIEQCEQSDIDIIVACSKDAIVMVEGSGDEISEQELADALDFAQQAAKPVIELIEELREAVGKEKMDFQPPTLDAPIASRVAELVDADLDTASRVREKHARYAGYDELKKKMLETLKEELGEEAFTANLALIKDEFGARKSAVVRGYVLAEKKRIDGRNPDDIRAIATDAGVLLRAHGSALFQRGETQAIASTTLGTAGDKQKIDGLNREYHKSFFLHYNFPPY